MEQWPLEGIRVVDFGHYLAGPLMGMLLADQGTNVVKFGLCPSACARFKRTHLKLFKLAPASGLNSRDILREAGWDEGEVDAFIGGGIVFDRFHEAYLPH